MSYPRPEGRSKPAPRSLGERASNAWDALTTPVQPIKEPPDYLLNPESMPRRNPLTQGVLNMAGAWGALQPDPIEVRGLGGEPMQFDAGGFGTPMGIGALDKRLLAKIIESRAAAKVPKGQVPLYQGLWQPRVAPKSTWWTDVPEQAVSYARKGGAGGGVINITGSRDIVDRTMEEMAAGKDIPEIHSERVRWLLDNPRDSSAMSGIGYSKNIRDIVDEREIPIDEILNHIRPKK